MRNWGDESGQLLVVVALSMTVLLGFVAFATDIGLMLREQRVVQTAADAAALGGAAESLYEGTPSTVTSGMWSAAAKDAELNGFAAGASNGTESTEGSTLTINIHPNVTVSDFNSGGYVQAIAVQKTPTVFMNLFGFQSMDVSATAIAANTLQSDGCIYVQDDGDYDPDDTVDLNGHSLIASPSCGMTVNGSISAGGSSTIDAKFVTASGAISGGSSSWISGVPSPPDPLAYLQETADQPSTPPNTASGTCTVPSSWGFTGGCILNYDGGNISGSLANDTVYVFDSSHPPVFTQNATISGSNVAIYVMGNDPIDFYNGTLSLTPSGPNPGNSADSCSDPTNTNPLCGVLIDAPTDGGTNGTYACSSGEGNNASNPGGIYFDFGSSSVTLTGIVYAPYMQLFVQDQGASTSFNTDLVIGNICAQSGDLTVNGFSGESSPIRRVGLVQ
jgi:hypothetical protein